MFFLTIWEGCIYVNFGEGHDLFYDHSITKFLTFSLAVTLDQILFCCEWAVMCIVRNFMAFLASTPLGCQKYSCCCENQKCLQKLLNVPCGVRGLSPVESHWCKEWCCGFVSKQLEKRDLSLRFSH